MLWDVLIVGQGIGGTLLSFILRQQGKKVLILDSPQTQPNCSRTATALLNPITGKRLRLEDDFDCFNQAAEKIYHDLSAWLETSIVDYHPVIRIFADAGQQNDWMTKLAEENYRSFFLHDKPENNIHPALHHPFGACRQVPMAQVKADILLQTFRQRAIAAHFLREEKMDFSRLRITSQQVNYDDIQATHIIFCTGWTAEENPYFPNLSFQPALGQLLHIEADDLPDKTIILGPAVISPREEARHFSVGSIYDWNNTHSVPTAENREKLILQLHKTIRCPYRITGESAAIRPTTPSRIPLIRQHEQGLPAYVFNGLGTKGYSWGPGYAQRYLASWKILD
jgi:glycine oxidase